MCMSKASRVHSRAMERVFPFDIRRYILHFNLEVKEMLKNEVS